MPGEKKMKVNRWRWPVGIGVAVVLAVTVAVGVGALIAHDRKPQAQPVALTSQPPTPSVVVDEHAKKACALNEQAADQLKLNDVPTVQAILAEAKQSNDDAVRFGAQMLSDEQEISNAAIAGNSGDLGLELAVLKASTQMSTTCVKQGYVP